MTRPKIPHGTHSKRSYSGVRLSSNMVGEKNASKNFQCINDDAFAVNVAFVCNLH